jgi:hypothetical protein
VKDGASKSGRKARKSAAIEWGSPVEVEWTDACGIPTALPLGEAAQAKAMNCRSMGWLLGAGDGLLRLTPSVYDDQTCMDTLVIPLGWVHLIKKI